MGNENEIAILKEKVSTLEMEVQGLKNSIDINAILDEMANRFISFALQEDLVPKELY